MGPNELALVNMVLSLAVEMAKASNVIELARREGRDVSDAELQDARARREAAVAAALAVD